MKCARPHPGRTGALLSSDCRGGRVLTGRSVPTLARRVLITVSRTYMGRSTAQLHHGNQVSLVILVTLIECRGWLTFYTRLAWIIIIDNCGWLQNTSSQYFRCSQSTRRLRNQYRCCPCTLRRPPLGVSVSHTERRLSYSRRVASHLKPHVLAPPRADRDVVTIRGRYLGTLPGCELRELITNCLSFVRTISRSLKGFIRQTVISEPRTRWSKSPQVEQCGVMKSRSRQRTCGQQQRAGQGEIGVSHSTGFLNLFFWFYVDWTKREAWFLSSGDRSLLFLLSWICRVMVTDRWLKITQNLNWACRYVEPNFNWTFYQALWYLVAIIRCPIFRPSKYFQICQKIAHSINWS